MTKPRTQISFELIFYDVHGRPGTRLEHYEPAKYGPLYSVFPSSRPSHAVAYTARCSTEWHVWTKQPDGSFGFWHSFGKTRADAVARAILTGTGLNDSDIIAVAAK